MATPDHEAQTLAASYVLLALYPYYNNLLGATLERKGLIVRKRSSIEPAVNLATQVRPSAMVLLVGKSDPDGLALLRQVKDRMGLDNLVVVAVVEENQGHLASVAMEAGVQRCFVVPFSPAELADYVVRGLGARPDEPSA